MVTKVEGDLAKKKEAEEGEAEISPDPGTWMILLVFSGLTYILLLVFPADQETRGTLCLLVHALLHTAWHVVLGATAGFLVNILEEVPFTLKSD